MLEFYETYSMVDVWTEFNKNTGKNQYVFWYSGKSYQRETLPETRALIQFLKRQKEK